MSPHHMPGGARYILEKLLVKLQRWARESESSWTWLMSSRLSHLLVTIFLLPTHLTRSFLGRKWPWWGPLRQTSLSFYPNWSRQRRELSSNLCLHLQQPPPQQRATSHDGEAMSVQQTPGASCTSGWEEETNHCWLQSLHRWRGQLWKKHSITYLMWLIFF